LLSIGDEPPDASGGYPLNCLYVANRGAGVLAASRAGGRVHAVDFPRAVDNRSGTT